MTARTGAGPTFTVWIGEGVQTVPSNDLWYRHLTALADLYIVGEIDNQELSDAIPRREPAALACPAARAVLGALLLAMDEPSCLCVANWEAPPCVRGCVPMDRRERLRELLGVAS